jgi:hypothetical protein
VEMEKRIIAGKNKKNNWSTEKELDQNVRGPV